jgi:hypothetical protein
MTGADGQSSSPTPNRRSTTRMPTITATTPNTTHSFIVAFWPAAAVT